MRFDVLDGGMDIDLDYVDVDATELRQQLAEYSTGERRTFDVEVDFPDSFTGRVMDAMAAIPYGETRTYGELAEELGTSPRAVGGGCGRNPVGIVVPCHRVLRSDGGLGGFSAEDGLELKRRLLDHEAAHR